MEHANISTCKHVHKSYPRALFCSSSDLGVLATVAAMKQIDLDPKLVEDVVFGNVSQTAVDTPYRKSSCTLEKDHSVWFVVSE
jgi:hypothetical protein